jgi:hypothetical protein
VISDDHIFWSKQKINLATDGLLAISPNIRKLDDFFTPSGHCWRATRQGIAGWRLIDADERREWA